MPTLVPRLTPEMTMMIPAPTSVPMPATRHASVLDMIGNTPMVDVSNLSPNPDVRILGKMEMQNPFGASWPSSVRLSTATLSNCPVRRCPRSMKLSTFCAERGS